MNVKELSLIVAIIGIVMIFAVSVFIEPEQVPIGSIEFSDSGRHVIINGTISEMSVSGGHIFLTVEDSTGSILVVMFERDANQDVYNMKAGNNVVIEGQINVYKNELEIIARDIKEK